jgi:hypothetical protein
MAYSEQDELQVMVIPIELMIFAATITVECADHRLRQPFTSWAIERQSPHFQMPISQLKLYSQPVEQQQSECERAKPDRRLELGMP